MQWPRFIRKWTYSTTKRKLISSIRERCEHKRVRYLGNKEWTKYSPLGVGGSGYFSSDTYRADHFKCKNCGKTIRQGSKQISGTSHKRIGETRTWIATTENYETGETTQVID